MRPRPAAMCVRTVLGSAAIACALFAASVSARDQHVTVAVHVGTRGLDLSRPADARTLCGRLQNAAWVACTRGDQVNLAPVEDLRGCLEKAIAGAVRSAKVSLLTQIYLETHTIQEAARQGIEVPAQVAAK